MKTLYITFASLFISLMTIQSYAMGNGYNRGYNGNSFIFVEGGVEFSVFPDGQFDFIYLGNQGSPVTISSPNVAVTYNSGYNYDAFVQYDSYGAVIQVEDVPIFYDYYGRISQAGNVTIRYRNNRLVQVGGLFVHYNPYGYYSHYSGFINPYNRFYVYRPWHAYYAVPYPAYCVVFANPYRTYYTPVRYSYSYHTVHYNSNHSYSNGRRDFHRPGSMVHSEDGRVATNRNFNSSGRSNQKAVATTYRRDDSVLRNNAQTRNSSSATTRGTQATSNTSRNANAESNVPERGINAGSSSTRQPISTAVRNNNSTDRQSNDTAVRTNSTARQSNSNAVRTNSTAQQTNNNAVRTSSTARQTNSTAVRNTNSTVRQTNNTAVRDTNTRVRSRSTTTPASNRNVQQATQSRSQNTSATRATSTSSRAATSSRGGRG